MTAAPPVPDQQVLQKVQADFSGQLVDQHGDAAAPAGTATLDITKADGTAVVTGVATTGTSSGPRGYALAAAANPELQMLTAVWKDGGTERLRTLVEVVGGFYFNAAYAESWDSRIDTSDAAKVRRVRRDVERECERITACSWVPRYRRFRISGTGTIALALPAGLWAPRSVRSVRSYSSATEYTAFTADELAAIEPLTEGILVRRDGATWPHGDENLVVELEHGFDRPEPDLLDAALKRFRHNMKTNKVVDFGQMLRFQTAEGHQVDLGEDIELDVEQRDVFRVYVRYSKRLPGIA